MIAVKQAVRRSNSALFTPTRERIGALFLLGVVLVWSGLVASTSHAQEDDTEAAVSESSEVTEEEQKRFDMFSERLSHTTWRGHFAVDGKSGELSDEVYQIKSVKKLPGDQLWMFQARIKYGDHDVTVPLPLKVSWASDTPMIVVDDVTIPGMGTFDARVLIRNDRYAGTWQHGDVGGHLFGKIEKTDGE